MIQLGKRGYELALLRKELGETKTKIIIGNMGGGKEGDRNENQQIREMQSAMVDMKQKGIQIREQIEEVKSWTQIVKGLSSALNEVIEKQVRRQIREEKNK